MGEAIAELGWPRQSLRADHQGVLGPRTGRAQHENTLNRKYLHAGDRRLARALRARLRRLLFCHRADPDTPIEETVWAMSDIVVARQGAVLGHQRVVGRRDPRRVGDRRAPPPAQAGHGAAAVQPARTASGSRTSTPALYDDIGSAPRSGARWRRGLLTGKYRDGIPDGSPRRARRATSGCAERADRRRRRGSGSSACGRSPTSSAARSPSSPWRGAR